MSLTASKSQQSNAPEQNRIQEPPQNPAQSQSENGGEYMDFGREVKLDFELHSE